MKVQEINRRGEEMEGKSEKYMTRGRSLIRALKSLNSARDKPGAWSWLAEKQERKAEVMELGVHTGYDQSFEEEEVGRAWTGNADSKRRGGDIVFTLSVGCDHRWRWMQHILLDTGCHLPYLVLRGCETCSPSNCCNCCCQYCTCPFINWSRRRRITQMVRKTIHQEDSRSIQYVPAYTYKFVCTRDTNNCNSLLQVATARRLRRPDQSKTLERPLASDSVPIQAGCS